MNTKIHYLYRDAANYKQFAEVVVAGVLSYAQLAPYLDDGEYFCPDDVGLAHPGNQWGEKGYQYPTEDDHCWCELDEDGVTPTEEPADPGLTAGDLLDRFRLACEAGWPASLVQQ